MKIHFRSLKLWIGVLIVVVTGALWASIGVSTKPSGRDLIGFDSCSGLCWKGIQPGRSHAADLQKVLDENNLLQSSRVKTLEDARSRSYIIYWGDRRVEGTNVAVFDETDTVVELEIMNYTNLTLGDVTDAFGPPDSSLAFETGELIIFQYMGYYPHKGVAVTINIPYTSRPQLSRTLPITQVSYFQFTNSEDMFTLPFIPRLRDAKCTMENWQPWYGFEELRFLPHIPCV